MLFVLTRIWVLANDVMKVWIINKPAVLLLCEHEFRGSGALHVCQIDMDEHEENEYEHSIVMDDTHRHGTTDNAGRPCHKGPIHGRRPKAEP